MGPILLLALSAVLVSGNSLPSALPRCDAEDPTLGYIVQGNQTGREMWWVAAAVRTDAYTVRTGDSCGGDPTSYVPGQLMGIHVRTHNYKGQFRGIMLYAVATATGERVGDWELPWPNSNMFFKPGGACQNKTLMHLNGAEKYYHHEFLWRAPPAGTGNVEFHCLIKRGQANLGEFYWPNLNGNLQLSEGAAVGGNKWVEGDPGQDCNAACAAAGSTCDANIHNNAFNFGSALQRDVVINTGCNNPPLESPTQAIFKDPYGWCYYPGPGVGVATAACSLVAPNGSKPLCSCGSAGQPSPRVFAPRDTACLNGYVFMGSAYRASSSLASIALMVFATLFFWQSRTSSALVLGLVLGCAHVAQAHNWVMDVSRSFNQASTYKPCRPRVDDSPHWQINEGQTFNMEWATGHDWYFWFTVVNSKDLERLNNIGEKHLREYIDDCQPHQDYMRTKTASPDPWRKQHINQNLGSGGTLGMTGQPIYSRNVSAGDPVYIPRHPKFPTMSREVRWVYTPENTNDDRRCNYYNPKYPFIIAVHRFVQVETVMSRASDRDIARFTIDLTDHRPYGYGQGSYVLQYLWRGYFDCADVDVFDSTTPIALDMIGGRPLLPTEPQWSKVDHCQFEEIDSVQTPCMEVVTDAETVLNACLGRANCQGVNVVPLWLPSEVYPLFSNRVGIEWGNSCPKNLFATLGRNTLVGYGVLPRLPNNTHASYSVTDDPEDPLFYATCFIKKPQWKFDLVVANDPNITVIYVPPPWAFSDRCVDCNEWKSAQDTKIIPRWALPQRCKNCELENVPPTQVPVPTVVARGQKCDGSWNGATVWNYGAPNAQCSGVRCVKTLFLVGVGTNVPFTEEQCIAKAKLDPECGDYVQHNTHLSRTCECWIKSNPGCCGVCKPVDYDFRNWAFNVYSIAAPSADPMCASGQGIPSADGAYCCPKSCGSCQSKPLFQVSFQSSVYQAPRGWAVDSGEVYGVRTNTWPQAFDTYGWNCLRSDQAEDRDATAHQAKNNPGTSYHSTVIKTDAVSCPPQAVWDVQIGNNGTETTVEVHTLYTKPFTSHRGCTLNGVANYDPSHSSLGQNDMAWVVRTVTTSTGKITWAGTRNSNCGAIAALKIYASSAGSTAVDCQTLTGQCCPQFLDMENRPCSTHPPPCSLV